jgi:hypothetical protein
MLARPFGRGQLCKCQLSDGITNTRRELRCTANRTLVETQEVVLRGVVRRRPQVLNSVKHVRLHWDVIPPDFDMEAVFAAVDHVGDLLTREVPELPLRIDATNMSDVFPRAMRVWLGEGRLLAAEHLSSELTKIIEGDPPYDIFVRWKPLHGQPIGWEPDIDDGVRINIRPFLTAKPKNSGRRDGCILRVTPRVKKLAGADRGSEPHREKDAFPWFWAEDSDVATPDFTGHTTFKGRRYNDFHYTRAFKQRARDARSKKS